VLGALVQGYGKLRHRRSHEALAVIGPCLKATGRTAD
jgi:hypothetical protein